MKKISDYIENKIKTKASYDIKIHQNFNRSPGVEYFYEGNMLNMPWVFFDCDVLSVREDKDCTDFEVSFLPFS